jgi:hypothetical protein
VVALAALPDRLRAREGALEFEDVHPHVGPPPRDGLRIRNDPSGMTGPHVPELVQQLTEVVSRLSIARLGPERFGQHLPGGRRRGRRGQPGHEGLDPAAAWRQGRILSFLHREAAEQTHREAPIHRSRERENTPNRRTTFSVRGFSAEARRNRAKLNRQTSCCSLGDDVADFRLLLRVHDWLLATHPTRG